MTTAPDHLGTLRGALSDWLYDPRHTAAPYEAQAAHADAIEAALAECEREGMGDVGRDFSRGHGWEDTAACWVWRLPRWDGHVVRYYYDESSDPLDFFGAVFYPSEYTKKKWIYRPHQKEQVTIDWFNIQNGDCVDLREQWQVFTALVRRSRISLKSPEGLALLDTARPKVTL